MDLKRKIDLLEATNSELVEKMNEYRSKCAFVVVNNSELVQKTNDYSSKCAFVVLDDKDANPEMKLHGSPDVEACEQQSREKIIALEEDKRSLQMERHGLHEEIARLEALGESTAKVQTVNAQNPRILRQISDLETKHEQEIDFIKQKCHDAKTQLQDELRGIKSQKVQLQQKVKQDEEQYRQWKADHEKQMLQVLQRKTEEAERATKKLKVLLTPQKLTARHENNVQPRGQSRSGQIKTLKRWLDNELDKMMHEYKLRTDHEHLTLSPAMQNLGRT